MRVTASAHRLAGVNVSLAISLAGTDQNRKVAFFVHGLIRRIEEACGSVLANAACACWPVQAAVWPRRTRRHSASAVLRLNDRA